MSFAQIWRGNFHQLRNSLGSNRGFKLLWFQTRSISRKTFDARRSISRSVAAKAEGKSRKSHRTKPLAINLNRSDGTVGSSSDVNTNKQKPYKNETVKCYKNKDCNERVLECPATFIVIDIETTGFSRKSERIIEIALRDLIGGKNSTFQTLVNPDKFIYNTDIHGISSHMVNKPDVPRFGELIPILMQFVRSRQIEGKPVVFIAHNGRRFDIPFIISEFQRCSVEVPKDWLFIDTLPLARQLVKPDGSKLKSTTLAALREHYEQQHELPLVGPAHRAMQDVITLCYVFQRITFDLKLTKQKLIGIAMCWCFLT